MNYKIPKCVDWIRQYFKINGSNHNAIIEISGDINSAIVAALCVRALGKDRVIGVLMCNNDNAKDVVKALGIKSFYIDITSIYKEILRAMTAYLQIGIRNQENYGNIKKDTLARIRMTILYNIAAIYNGRVANTCNYTESFLGWNTKWGNNVGDFSPIGDIRATELLTWGDILTELPKCVFDGMNEENFGFTYADVENYMDCFDEKIDRETFKAIQHRAEIGKYKRCAVSLPTCYFNAPFLY